MVMISYLIIITMIVILTLFCSIYIRNQSRVVTNHIVFNKRNLIEITYENNPSSNNLFSTVKSSVSSLMNNMKGTKGSKGTLKSKRRSRGSLDRSRVADQSIRDSIDGIDSSSESMGSSKDMKESLEYSADGIVTPLSSGSSTTSTTTTAATTNVKRLGRQNRRKQRKNKGSGDLNYEKEKDYEKDYDDVRRSKSKSNRDSSTIDRDVDNQNDTIESREKLSEWIPGVAGAFLRAVDTIQEELFLSNTNFNSNTRTKKEAKTSTQTEDIVVFNNPVIENTATNSIVRKNVARTNAVATPAGKDSIVIYSVQTDGNNSMASIVSKELSVDDFSEAYYKNMLVDTYPYPPWLPYHMYQSQNYKQPEILYSPSFAYVKKIKEVIEKLDSENRHKINLPKAWKDVIEKQLPDMSMQKSTFEDRDLKIHLCNGVFEAYSASYLTTKQHMIEVKSEGFNLTWVNCEMASFIHMKESRSFQSNPNGAGMIMQSLDVLDFSVIHLSTYERSSKKYKHRLWRSKEDQKTKWSNIGPVEVAAKTLERKFNPKISGVYPKWSYEANRTLVVMPFLGGAMGAGHSELGNRFHYLRACFWSFYEFIPNIMMGVSRYEDVIWGRNHSGLPFYDIILLNNLPKSAGLPVGTTQQIKKRLLDGTYDFDYIFFTESDQILISRQLPYMYENLKKYPSRMLLPHRLMVYSDRLMVEIHNKSIVPNPVIQTDTNGMPLYTDILPKENEWMTKSCCMKRQNCQERKSWVPLKDPLVPVINYYGLYVPLGNVNFLAESYRTCNLTDYIGDYCP